MSASARANGNGSASAQQSTSRDRQSTGRDRRKALRSTAVDQYFELLRRCISDRGYTLDAVCASMKEQGGFHIDKAYLWRLLNDPATQEQWKVAHYVALPDDVEDLFESRRLESRGRVVAQAPTDDAEAFRWIVGGLLGLLRSPAKLPAKTSGPIKVSLSEDAR